MKANSWKKDVTSLDDSQDLYAAIRQLRDALEYTQLESDRREILWRLIKHYIGVSRHADAYEYAKKLESTIGLRHLPWPIALSFTMFYCLLVLIGAQRIGKSCARFLSRFILPNESRKDVTWDEIYWLLYANYWINIKRSSSYCVLEISIAKNTEQWFVGNKNQRTWFRSLCFYFWRLKRSNSFKHYYMSLHS